MSAWDEDKAEIGRTPSALQNAQEPREHSNYRCVDVVVCSVGAWRGRTDVEAPQQELNVACFGSCVVSHVLYPIQED